MTSTPQSRSYQEALNLAEAGQYDQALRRIMEHLSANSRDGQAWNDAGAIVYCMGQVDKAIEYFEKAKKICGICSETAEILWNLVEAYIDAGLPGKAAALLEQMQELEILNPDVVNRVANTFLNNEDLANAIEMLLFSLRLSPNQELLKPMTEVIRSKRASIAVIAEQDGGDVRSVYDYISRRFNAELFITESVEQAGQICERFDLVWFDGCGQLASDVSVLPATCRRIVRVRSEDIADIWPMRVNWSGIDSLVIENNSYVVRELKDQVMGIEEQTDIVSVGYGIEVGKCEFNDKNKGKRIACLGNFNNRSNIALLMQCMQKLNYIDGDYRLYLGGEFDDRNVELYTRYIIEKMGLTNSVFFDGEQANIDRWLRDKHFIVSTDISSGGVENVLNGMARGLKPVVHSFAGSDEVFDSDFIFDISERFCSLITCGGYEPTRYRGIVENQFEINHSFKPVHFILSRLERELRGSGQQGRVQQQDKSQPQNQIQLETNDHVQNGQNLPGATSDAGAGAIGFGDIKPAGQSVTGPDVQEASFEQSSVNSHQETATEKPGDVQGGNDQTSKAVPIEPMDINKITMPVTVNGKAYDDDVLIDGIDNAEKQGHSRKVPSKGTKSINRIAEAALEASRALSDIARKEATSGDIGGQAGQTQGGLEDIDTQGLSSLDDEIRFSKVQQVVSEFADSEQTSEGQQRAGEKGKSQAPFVSS
jgi:glycosyltransferase involved in cell wall biosynthesis